MRSRRLIPAAIFLCAALASGFSDEWDIFDTLEQTEEPASGFAAAPLYRLSQNLKFNGAVHGRGTEPAFTFSSVQTGSISWDSGSFFRLEAEGDFVNECDAAPASDNGRFPSRTSLFITRLQTVFTAGDNLFFLFGTSPRVFGHDIQRLGNLFSRLYPESGAYERVSLTGASLSYFIGNLSAELCYIPAFGFDDPYPFLSRLMGLNHNYHAVLLNTELTFGPLNQRMGTAFYRGQSGETCGAGSAETMLEPFSGAQLHLLYTLDNGEPPWLPGSLPRAGLLQDSSRKAAFFSLFSASFSIKPFPWLETSLSYTFRERGIGNEEAAALIRNTGTPGAGMSEAVPEAMLQYPEIWLRHGFGLGFSVPQFTDKLSLSARMTISPLFDSGRGETALLFDTGTGLSFQVSANVRFGARDSLFAASDSIFDTSLEAAYHPDP